MTSFILLYFLRGTYDYILSYVYWLIDLPTPECELHETETWPPLFRAPSPLGTAPGTEKALANRALAA